MSGVIGPGTWVVAADDCARVNYGDGPYLVLSVWPMRGCCNACGRSDGAIVMKGVEPNIPGSRHCEHHWRPIRSDISEIERLLETPVSIDHPEKVDAG